MIERRFSNWARGKGKFMHLMEMGRPWNGLVMFVVAFLGVLMVGAPLHLLTTFCAGLAFLLLYMGGTTLNDIADVDADKVNMPYRPLQEARLKQEETIAFGVINYLLGLGLAYILGWQLFGAALLFILFSIVYSAKPFYFMGRGFFGNLTLALVTLLIPAFGGAAMALKTFSLPSSFWAALLPLTMVFAFASLSKDLKDIKGDERHGKQTTAVKIGKRQTLAVGIVGLALFFPLTIYDLAPLIDGGSMLFFMGSYVAFMLLMYVKAADTERYDQIYEEARFSKLRIIIFAYVIFAVALAATRAAILW